MDGFWGSSGGLWGGICLCCASPFGQLLAGYLPAVGSRSGDGYFWGASLGVVKGVWWPGPGGVEGEGEGEGELAAAGFAGGEAVGFAALEVGDGNG
jgi:hypothetical protein